MSWTRIIDDDNRRGVMAGLDKDGVPMAPVTYRPLKTLPTLKPTKAQKNTNNGRARRGHFSGYGPAAAGLHNNLTPGEYRRLGGPPLAPRGPFSRVITNLRLRFGRISAMAWEAVGYWDEVVTAKGRKFLHYHFEGAGRLPRRDLRGVRPDGLRRAAAAARAWMIDMIRSNGA